MPCVRPLPDEYNSPKACNDADACPTLRTGVRGMYLTAPLDAQARSKVQTGLLGILHTNAARHAARPLAFRLTLPHTGVPGAHGGESPECVQYPWGSHDTRRGCYGQSFAGSGEPRRPASSTG